MAEIIFTANVGADAELRYTKSQEPVCSFRAAESKSRKLDDGSWETLREHWFDVSLFGPAAVAMAPEIRKGDRVKVAGEFWRRDYDSQNGPGTSLDVKATGVQILPKRGGGQQPGGGFSGNTSASAAGAWGGSTGGGWGTPPADDEPAF